MVKFHNATGKGGGLLRLVVILFVTLGAAFGPAAAFPIRAPVGDLAALEADTLAGLSAGEWSSLRAQMAAAQYQFTWQEWQGEWAYRAPNPAQGLDLAFGLEGLRATRYQAGTAAGELGLALLAYGDSPMQPLAREQLTADKTRVEYRWDEQVTEWYENQPEGVEHGLILAAPPAQGETVLTFALRGDLRAIMDHGGGGLRLVDNGGRTTLRYDALRVVDAAGRELGAWMEMGGEGEHTGSPLRIVIDAQEARYPITVDPLIYSQAAILRASDRQAYDLFGYSVAVSGDTIVVGAENEDGGVGNPLNEAGAAYVFTRNKNSADLWGQVAILRASDRQAGDRFGISVAISGYTVVVGAPYEDGGVGNPDSEAGAAYVFTRNQGGADVWGQVAILRASDRQAIDFFGWSVTISRDIIVVGAPSEDGGVGDPVNSAGAAYVFYRNQGGADAWGQASILRASDRQANDEFGISVAISGYTLVVGAHYEDGGVGDPAASAGAAYVFVRMKYGIDSWWEEKILHASDLQAGDYFGQSVAVDGDTVVVGAYREDGGVGNPDSEAGAAYVFTRNWGGMDQWGEVSALRASDRQADDYFGWSVAISGDAIVVGAFYEDGGMGDPIFQTGAVYIFTRNQGGTDHWGEAFILRASDRQADDYFGYAVAISGNTIVVGAFNEDGGAGDPLTETGAAYTFVGEGALWQEIAIPRAYDRQPDDQYGYSVAISGDTAVVGAPYEDGGLGDPVSGAGAAYVLTRNVCGADVWGEVRILRSIARQVNDNFGWSVAISGDTIVVGALNEDGGAGDPLSSAGAAYIFRRNLNSADAWGQGSALRASDRQANDTFGWSVAISGDTVVVGAPFEDGGAGNPVSGAGAAYVFRRNQNGADMWGEVTILRASDRQATDFFGSSVAISGETIVVGANFEDGGAGSALPNAGAAYVFTRNQGGAEAWGEIRILRASEQQEGDFFGCSVAIDGDAIVVGAYAEDGGAGDLLDGAGAAYVFKRNMGGANAWGEVAILRASDRQTAEDYFGISVAISGDTILAGAYGEDGGVSDPLSEAGTAYVFARNKGGADAWGETAILRASDRQTWDYFGYSVAISHNTIIVGAYMENGGAGDPVSAAGAAYIFTWIPYQVMLPLVSHQ